MKLINTKHDLDFKYRLKVVERENVQFILIFT